MKKVFAFCLILIAIVTSFSHEVFSATPEVIINSYTVEADATIRYIISIAGVPSGEYTLGVFLTEGPEAEGYFDVNTHTITINNQEPLSIFGEFEPSEEETVVLLAALETDPVISTTVEIPLGAMSEQVPGNTVTHITVEFPNGPGVNADGNCIDGVSTNPNIYCLLEPIGTGGNVWNYINIGGTGTSNQVGEYLNGLFQIGVALAGILGVFLIIMGGFQYMTTDAISKTTEGKKMIRNAITGILLALLSWLLLSTVSNNLIDFTIGTYQSSEGSEESETGVGNEYIEGQACQAIQAQASEAADNQEATCNAPGTNGGSLACAWLADTIIQEATGEYLGGGSNPTLATATLINQLQSNESYALVGSVVRPLSDSPEETVSLGLQGQPGDIIISPTIGSAVGHVGICETADCAVIISNSSSSQSAQRNFNFNSWKEEYNNNNLYIFRHTDCVNEG